MSYYFNIIHWVILVGGADRRNLLLFNRPYFLGHCVWNMSERLVEYLVIAGPGKTSLRPEASSAGRNKISSETDIML